MRRGLAGAICAVLAVTGTPEASAAAVPASCHVTKAAFKKMPFKATPKRLRGLYGGDFVQFSTTRAGLWAGVAYRESDATIRVVTWRAKHRPKVLATYRYGSRPWDAQRSVVPIGIAPRRVVVARVIDPHRRLKRLAAPPYIGVYWSRGRAHQLAHPRAWWAVAPVTVTDSGRVIGYAAIGSARTPHFYAVSWASVASRTPTVVADLGGSPTVTATTAGDIAWTRPDGYSFARLRDGSVHQLKAGRPGMADYVSQSVYPLVANGSTVVGLAGNGTATWRLVGARPGDIYPSGPSAAATPEAIGRRGDLLVTYNNRSTVITNRGRTARLPRQLLRDNADGNAHAIDEHGRVAFTSKKDRRVHFLVCH